MTPDEAPWMVLLLVCAVIANLIVATSWQVFLEVMAVVSLTVLILVFVK